MKTAALLLTMVLLAPLASQAQERPGPATAGRAQAPQRSAPVDGAKQPRPPLRAASAPMSKAPAAPPAKRLIESNANRPPLGLCDGT